MSDFFVNPTDLMEWVRKQESADVAAQRIMDLIGEEEEQDVVETCRAIFEDDAVASEALFGVLAKHGVVQLEKESKIQGRLTKQAAQVIRAPGLFNSMPLTVCPKLPKSMGNRRISTYNCMEHCIDGITFDDDPLRVYCGEKLWRRHIQDKFSREWKDASGKFVGGYINDRFYVFPDAGTPANPDAPRDGGNQMELAYDERTRLPRPHQYSTERRLSEQRGEKTQDITVEAFGKKQFIKVASVEESGKSNKIEKIFTDVVDMHEAGIGRKEIIAKVSEHYKVPILHVAHIYKVAMGQLQRHAGTPYSYTHGSPSVRMTKVAGKKKDNLEKEAFSAFYPGNFVQVLIPLSGTNRHSKKEVVLEVGKVFEILSDGASPVLGEVDDRGRVLSQYIVSNSDLQSSVNVLDNEVESGAEEVGLTESAFDFPVVEAPTSV